MSSTLIRPINGQKNKQIDVELHYIDMQILTFFLVNL